MKFLLDMNLSPAWVDDLASLGHAAEHWHRLGAPDAEDARIAAYARAHDMVVITSDLDFGKILFAGKFELPSVIQLRLGDLRPASLLDTLDRTIIATRADLEKGALVTIGSNRVRITMLPLAGGDEQP